MENNVVLSARGIYKEFPGVKLGQPILATVSQVSILKEASTEAAGRQQKTSFGRFPLVSEKSIPKEVS